MHGSGFFFQVREKTDSPDWQHAEFIDGINYIFMEVRREVARCAHRKPFLEAAPHVGVRGTKTEGAIKAAFGFSVKDAA